MTLKRPFAYAVAALAAGLLAGTAIAQKPMVPPKPVVSDDGTITVPSFQLPFSSYASPEAREEFVRRVHAPMPYMADLKKVREMTSMMLVPIIAREKALYPVQTTVTTMGGVPVQIYTPTAGIAPENQQRVLIEVHGGGFVAGGGGPGGADESIPISGVGRIKVIAVDYRMGPEYHFPAASEDLASVYSEVLKTYRPQNIGIFGCSAGGMLTAESIPWFLKVHLPLPGALGIFCASTHAFGGGDSFQLWPRLGSVIPVLPPANPDSGPFMPDSPDYAYFAGASKTDPLAVPSASKQVMQQFPPTLFLTGTRAPDMSGAVESHLELMELGVPTQLVLFDGLDHGFFADPDLPESKIAYTLITRFFEENLGH